MSLADFNNTKLKTKVTETLLANEAHPQDGLLYHTSIGIQITFVDESIHAISIDPNVTLTLNGQRLTEHTSLSKYIALLYANGIAWRFVQREADHECAIKTQSGVEVIFTFAKDDVCMSKFYLSRSTATQG